MTTLRTSAIALVLAAGAAAGMTGCSKQEAPKAKDAWNKAQDTLGTYKSLELKGDGTSDGEPAAMTMKGDVDGDPMQLSGKLNGGSVEMIVVGSKQYMKADEAFFKSSDSSQQSAVDSSKFSNVWLELPKTEASSADSFTSLVKELQDDSSDSNKKLLSDKASVTEDKVDGKDAWKITSEDKKVTAWVSQEDSRDILKVEGVDAFKSSAAASKDTMKTATFLSHDKDYGIKAPSGAKSMQDIVSESMK